METIKDLIEIVATAGKTALAWQKNYNFSDRDYKEDGSILTEIDTKIDEYLFKEISILYREANILTEERKRIFDPSKKFTFAVDPVDGTDVFSQGMPSWCVSVGLLDEKLKPAAGIIYSPSLDLLFFKDIKGPAFCNGKEIKTTVNKEDLLYSSNVMVPSKLQKRFDLSKFPAKLRNFGSTALQLVFPLIYPAVTGAVTGRTHIWDIAAGHALNNALGMDLKYFSGENITYGKMIDGSQAEDYILSGTPGMIKQIKSSMKRL